MDLSHLFKVHALTAQAHRETCYAIREAIGVPHAYHACPVTIYDARVGVARRRGDTVSIEPSGASEVTYRYVDGPWEAHGFAAYVTEGRAHLSSTGDRELTIVRIHE